MSTRASTQSDATRGLENLPEVTEIRLVGLGIRGRRPLLLARLRDQEVVIYELYEYQSPSLSPDQLKIRFR